MARQVNSTYPDIELACGGVTRRVKTHRNIQTLMCNPFGFESLNHRGGVGWQELLFPIPEGFELGGCSLEIGAKILLILIEKLHI